MGFSFLVKSVESSCFLLVRTSCAARDVELGMILGRKCVWRVHIVAFFPTLVASNLDLTPCLGSKQGADDEITLVDLSQISGYVQVKYTGICALVLIFKASINE